MGTSVLSIANLTRIGDARFVGDLLQPSYWWVLREYVDINLIIYDGIAVNILFWRYLRNLWYLNGVLNCFFRRRLTSKRMNFWFQLRTCHFTNKSIVKLVLNLSALIINISSGRSLKNLEILHTHNIGFRLQHIKFSQFNLITSAYILKTMWTTTERKRDSFSGALGGVRETHWEWMDWVAISNFEHIIMKHWVKSSRKKREFM